MVPKFYGEEDEEAWGWLIYMEQHFKAKSIYEEEKLKEAIKGLRGKAFCWYRHWSWFNPNASWWTFNKAFIEKYIPEICLIEDDAEPRPETKMKNHSPNPEIILVEKIEETKPEEKKKGEMVDEETEPKLPNAETEEENHLFDVAMGE